MISGLIGKTDMRLNHMRSLYIIAIIAGMHLNASAEDSRSTTLQLARELSNSGDHSGAALEFRRLALQSDASTAKGGYYWASAHEYWKAGQHDLADRMLDHVEDDFPPPLPSAVMLVRSENAADGGNRDEAKFYYEGLMSSNLTDEEKSLAARRLSEIHLRQLNIDQARETLLSSPIPNPAGLDAISRYESGRDKKPWIGGLLGIIPGLGYFYAGEYANGFRSIILNGLFIYGMVDTAKDEHWGAFTVITFFEFTWYSGSIYGGIDASHRYNQERMDAAASSINGSASFQPDYQQLPLISLRFSF